MLKQIIREAFLKPIELKNINKISVKNNVIKLIKVFIL